MNEYLKNLDKIEFVVSYACTGKCKHCAEGDHELCGERIDPQMAADAVRRIASEYNIRTVMAFGGEPLLHTDAVYAIMNAANEMRVPCLQIISNGYFSKDPKRIREVAERLAECGVNDLLLSVDAFHQETIPLDVVRAFAAEAKRCGVQMRLSPAWLVSTTHDNPYNKITREILESLSDLEIPIGEGNIVFPSGNARKYLSEYFTGERLVSPYYEDPHDVHCISFSPNGDVLGSNAYRYDIMEIINAYTPENA